MASTTQKPRKLTAKQQAFIERFVQTNNATEAADGIYGSTRQIARNIASETLAKPYIKEALSVKYAEVQEKLQEHSTRALQVISELVENADEDKVRLGAAKDILDRAGHKPVEKSVSVSVKKAINLDI